MKNRAKFFYFFACLSLLSCSTRVLHPDLKPDPGVMVREWVRPLHVVDPRVGPTVLDRGVDFSSPILWGNTLVFGSSNEGVVALYPSLGLKRWSFRTEDGGVPNEVTIDGGKIYFGSSNGFFYSIHLENGRLDWKTQLRQSRFSRAVVEKGRVFVSTAGDTVHAIDTGSGEAIWTYRRKSSPVATIHSSSTPLVDGEEVLVGLSDGVLVALNKQDGSLKWEKKLHSGTKFMDVDAKIQMVDGVLYVPSYDGALYALRRRDGNTIWRFDAGGSIEPLILGSRVYLPSSDGQVYAIDRNTGAKLWSFATDGVGVPTRIIEAQGKLIFGSSYQFLYVLETETGKPLYRWNAGRGSGFYGAPSFDASTNHVYLISSAGNLYSFLLQKHRVKGYDQPSLGLSSN